MTTTFYRVRALVCVASIVMALVLLAAAPTSAQREIETLAFEQGEATTTSSATEGTLTASEPVVEPWFRVEKLTGDNIAVGDMVVGPGKAEIEINPGQTIIYELSVSNRISDDRIFEITVEDVAGSADGSRSAQLLGSERGPYSLKDYISFPENRFTLDLGDRARIPVTISVPPDAEPGGFYGSVLISTVQSKEVEDPSATARSPIVARVGTLFFLTVPGETVKSGETKNLSLLHEKWWYEKGPIDLAVLYENTGSVLLNPYGELRIKNILGEEVGFVELDPWFVLPKSLRLREVTWDRELLFGRYVATVFINRGYDDVLDERSVVFWVLPWKIVGGIFLIVFISLLAIRLFFRTFEFKRK